MKTITQATIEARPRKPYLRLRQGAGTECGQRGFRIREKLSQASSQGAGPLPESQGVAAMTWVYDDGGRAAAGFKGEANDCVVRAIAIATGQPYRQVYDQLFELNRTNNKRRRLKRKRKASPREGNTHVKTITEYMRNLGGWEWVPTMKIGSGCRVHLRKEEVPKGTVICRIAKHVVCTIDGVIHDTWDCSKEGTSCVYGYWKDFLA